MLKSLWWVGGGATAYMVRSHGLYGVKTWILVLSFRPKLNNNWWCLGANFLEGKMGVPPEKFQFFWTNLLLNGRI